MTYKATLLDAASVNRALKRLSFEIVEKNKGTDNICILGIKRRGICIAKTIRDNIFHNENAAVPVGELDITFYRDDLSGKNPFPTVNSCDIGFDINGKTVIIADDVIFTGRTVRAAIEAVFQLGRPQAVQLAVLIDRGHRELPIKADYVGKNIPTSLNEIVRVTFPEYDNCETAVEIWSK